MIKRITKRSSKERVLQAAKEGYFAQKCFSDNLSNINPDILTDRDFVVILSRYVGHENTFDETFFPHFATYKDDKEIVSNVLKNNAFAIRYVSDDLKKNREIVEVAVLEDPTVLLALSDEVKGDFEIAKLAVSENGCILMLLDEKLRDNFEIAITAVNKSGHEAMGFVSDRLKDDFIFMKEAVGIDAETVLFASDRLKENQDFILNLIKENENVLQFFIKDKRLISYLNDKDFAFDLIDINPVCIKWLDSILRDDLEICFEAIKGNPHTLEYLSDRLKDDDYLVKTAVKIDASVLDFASKRMQNIINNGF